MDPKAIFLTSDDATLGFQSLILFPSRWPTRYDQWWECKFLSEGIIDQGGGFRDSLSDTADELNPVSADAPVPLPFFIRSPNQARPCNGKY